MRMCVHSATGAIVRGQALMSGEKVWDAVRDAVIPNVFSGVEVRAMCEGHFSSSTPIVANQVFMELVSYNAMLEHV